MANSKEKNLFLWAVLVLAIVSGCDKGNGMHPISGSVVINEEPAEDVIVTLRPVRISEEYTQKHGQIPSVPWGRTDAAGNFFITTWDDGDGAPVGEYEVLLRWPVDPAIQSPDRLRNAYFPDNAACTISVNEGHNVLDPIVLSNVKVLPKGKPSQPMPR